MPGPGCEVRVDSGAAGVGDRAAGSREKGVVMDYEISLDVSIRNYQGGGNIQLRESVTIKDCTFADMADILHGFHEMAEVIKKARKNAVAGA
jgi:hypothetical protein